MKTSEELDKITDGIVDAMSLISPIATGYAGSRKLLRSIELDALREESGTGMNAEREEIRKSEEPIGCVPILKPVSHSHGLYAVAVCLAHGYKEPESLPCPLCERAAREQAELALKAWVNQTRPLNEEELQKRLNIAESALAALKVELANSIDQNDLLAALTRRGLDVSGLDGDDSPEDIVANWVASECDALKLKLEAAKAALESVRFSGTVSCNDNNRMVVSEALTQLSDGDARKMNE